MYTALAWLLTLVMSLVVAVAILLTQFRDDLLRRWDEWQWESSLRTHRFVVFALLEDRTELRIPVWFETTDFHSAAWQAVDLQEELFPPWLLSWVEAVDRTSAYIHEPEEGWVAVDEE